ncbi:MAG: hypothetical protein JWP03_2789 [Phycisphaerales bacterium]|jgi:hypothetical protein|nr:hypothetical protein [Phycisphaerales bacterium]
MNPAPRVPFYVYKSAALNGQPEHTILSPLSPQEVQELGGLRDEAVIGEIAPGATDVSPESFVPNRAFVQFLHNVLAIHAPRNPGLMAAAQSGGTGQLLVLDKRVHVPVEQQESKDVIGVIDIQDGRLVKYTINPNHQLVTRDGYMVLDPWYQEKLIEELKKLGYQPAPAGAPPSVPPQ